MGSHMHPMLFNELGVSAGLRNYIANEFRASRRQKRGGGEVPISIDQDLGEERFKLEPSTGQTPESLYERGWALSLLEGAIERLGADYENVGRGALFAELRAYLPSAEKPPPLAELAERLGMGLSAATMSVHRMRQRFGEILRQEVANTVDDQSELDGELQHVIGHAAGISNLWNDNQHGFGCHRRQRRRNQRARRPPGTIDRRRVSTLQRLHDLRESFSGQQMRD